MAPGFTEFTLCLGVVENQDTGKQNHCMSYGNERVNVGMSEGQEGCSRRVEKWSLKTSFEGSNLVVLKSFIGKLLKFTSGSRQVLTKHLTLYSHMGTPKKPRMSL